MWQAYPGIFVSPMNQTVNDETPSMFQARSMLIQDVPSGSMVHAM